MVGLIILLASSAAGPNTAATTGPLSTWRGSGPDCGNGLISPIAFIASLFNPNVGLYEIHNNGAWYNFGFLRGIFIPLSGEAGAGVQRPGSSRCGRTRASS